MKLKELHLESEIPPFLYESIKKMEEAWAKLERGEKYTLWDCDYCELQSNINVCEVEHLISSELAWALREEYLGIEREI